MPFKSKSQWNKFFAMADRGEISEAEAKRWARKTKTPYKKLPKNAMLKTASDIGRLRAYHEAGLNKEAAKALLPLALGALLGAVATGAALTRDQTRSVTDQIRRQVATLPDAALIDLIRRGVPPTVAKHILSKDRNTLPFL